MLRWIFAALLALLAGPGLAADYSGPPSFPGVMGTVAPAQMPAFYDNLSVDPSTPFVLAIDGQSNAVGNGEWPSGMSPTTVPQTGGGIWAVDETNGIVVRAAYGTAPFTNMPITSSTPAANPGLEFAIALRNSGILQPSRPIYVLFAAKGGKSVCNWGCQKQDLNATLTPPSGITHLQNQISIAGLTHLDVFLMVQGENDSISAVADTYSGNAFADYGFGNTAANLAAGPYCAQATVDAITAAGGTNTSAGYQAAAGQAIANLRALPGASSTTPVIWAELHTFWKTNEFTRNIDIRQFSRLFPYVAVPSSSGLPPSDITGNNEHIRADGTVELAARSLKAYLDLYRTGKSSAPTGLGGAPVSLGQTLSLVNNLDNAGAGVSLSVNGDMYMIAPDLLRNPLYIRAVNSSVYLPLAGNIGGVDVDFDVWSISGGASYILTAQPLTGWPGSPTTGTYTLPWGSLTLYAYAIPSVSRIRLNSGSGRWAVISIPANGGLFRGNFWNASANIGTNAATAFLSGQLVSGNVATLSYTLGGSTSTVSATFDGSVNATYDATVAALAASLQTALGSTYTVDAIASVNALTVMGPSQVVFNAAASTVTGGASQGLWGAVTGAYALSPRHIGKVWGAAPNITYILPPSNLVTPGNVGLSANGGGGSAGPIWVDAWGDGLLDKSGLVVFGTWGANPFVGIPANDNCYFAPDLTARWLEVGGTCLTPSTGLAQGGQLGSNPWRLTLSAALVAGNSLAISGTATPNGGGATTITTVTQPWIQSSAITQGLAAQALQTSVSTVLTGATASAVWGQNIFQLALPTGATMALTGTVTGGASQATVAQDSGSYSFSQAQTGKDYYAPISGGALILPSPNGLISQRIGINGQTATAASTVTIAGGSFINRTGQVVSSFTLRPGMTSVLEASQANRWTLNGGSYLAWREGQNIASPTTGSTVALTSGAGNLAVYISGSNIAALTLTLPSSPLEGDRVEVESEIAITTLTLSGGTVVSGPTTMAAHSYFTLIYHTSGSRWTRNG